ncbi:TPA: hypothetical protein ACGN81_005771, partial [Bacillus cereus]
MIKNILAKGADSVSPIFKGVEILPDRSVARIGTNYGGKFQEADIALMIDGEEDGEFSEKQYASYNSLIQNWGHLQQSILQPILDYYKQKRHELGYDVSYNENYPLIETIDQLLERIRIVG